MTTTAQPRRTQQRVVLSLHGVDPASRTAATWHVTSLADDGAAGTYLVERADGDISNPAVWMQAHRDARTVSEDEVLDLVRTVFLRGGRAT